MNRANRRRQTRTNRRTDDATENTMQNVSHTHPYTSRGAVNRPFQRGPVVAADGGEREAYEEEEPTETENQNADAREEDDEREEQEGDQMKDVNHTPPHGASANPVFERGGTEEPVESEE